MKDFGHTVPHLLNVIYESGQDPMSKTQTKTRVYLDPDNPDLLYNLGLCYVDLGQLDRI